MGVGDSVQTLTIRFGECFFVHQFHQRTGMNVRDVVVGRVLLATLRTNILHLPVNNVDPLDGVTCNHLTTIGGDNVGKELCKMTAAINKPAGTMNVQRTDDGMNVCWCLVGTTAIQRIHIGQHTPQTFVLDIFGNKGISSHQKVIGLSKEPHLTCRRSQIEQIHLVSDSQYGIDITLQISLLFRKIL